MNFCYTSSDIVFCVESAYFGNNEMGENLLRWCLGY